jgi:hypothetical protein
VVVEDHHGVRFKKSRGPASNRRPMLTSGRNVGVRIRRHATGEKVALVSGGSRGLGPNWYRDSSTGSMA